MDIGQAGSIGSATRLGEFWGEAESGRERLCSYWEGRMPGHSPIRKGHVEIYVVVVMT